MDYWIKYFSLVDKKEAWIHIFWTNYSIPATTTSYATIICHFDELSSSLTWDCFESIICRNDELSWLFTNRLRATRYMKVKRMGITEILRRIWLFSADKVKISESVSKQPTQFILELNSSLWQKLGTYVLSFYIHNVVSKRIAITSHKPTSYTKG